MLAVLCHVYDSGSSRNEKSFKTMKVLARVLQVFIAALLLITSIGKLLDIRGFAQVLLTYHLFPESVVLPIALTLALFELLLSLWIFSGVQLTLSALTAVVLYLQFTVVAVISNLRGLDIPNCGCFGVFWAQPMSWVTVVEDMVLTAVCGVLFLMARRFPGEPALRLTRRAQRSI